jgi:hypothetical protein
VVVKGFDAYENMTLSASFNSLAHEFSSRRSMRSARCSAKSIHLRGRSRQSHPA